MKRQKMAGAALAAVLLTVCLGSCAGSRPASSLPNSAAASDTSVPGGTATGTSGTQPTESAAATDRAPSVTSGRTSAATSARPTAGTTSSDARQTSAATTSARPTGPRPTLVQPTGKETLDSRTYRPKQRIGDWGGPAYCAYSYKGHTQASMDVELSAVEIEMTRRSDGKTNVGYIFLGMDIYDPQTGAWANCLDAGLAYDGADKGWTLFHLLADANAPGQNKWYKGHRKLDETHDYRLTLDCGKSNGWATLTVYDLTVGRVADSIEFQARYARKDGSNVDFLQDFAIDMKDDTMIGTDGHLYTYKEVESSGISDEAWKSIILYNTDEGIRLCNVRITNAKLDGQPWTADKTRLRGFSPDFRQADIGYDVVRVHHATLDSELIVDIDMARR